MTELEFIKRIVFREYPAKIAWLMINEILGSFLVLVGAGGIITMLGSLLGGANALSGPMGLLLSYLGISQSDSLTILKFLVFLLLIQVLLDSIRQYLSSSISVNLTRDFRKKMNNALMATDWVQFSAIDQGKYMQTMVVESANAGGAVYHMGAMLASGLMTCMLLSWMLASSLDSFLIFVIAGGLFLFSVQALLKRSRRAGEESIHVMKEMNNVVTDTKHLFKVLIVENLVPRRIRIIDELIDKASSLELRKWIYRIINDQFLSLETVAIVLFVSYYFLQIRVGGTTDLIFNLLLLQRIGTYFGVFQNRRHLMIQQMPSYQACLEMIDIFEAPANDAPNQPKMASLDTGISLKKISYRYPRGIGGIKNITLSLPSKGLAFFVGRSGSGKTTLIDILLGLIRPDAGQILVDGKDLAEIDRQSFSRIVSYVPQQAYLFKGTLRENLTFGSDQAGDEKIFQSLDAVDCGEFVRSLPQGFDTPVVPGGINFSGGERHRISLARALIKGAQILVLDEPSSSLDTHSELSILQSLKRLSQEILVVVITHSQRIIQDMDNIYLLDQGSCIWHGNYAQLMMNEYYADVLNEPDGK